MDQTQRQRAIALLEAPPSHGALLGLIAWLDLACAGAPGASLPHQILARAVAALGHQLLDHGAPATVERTTEAAERYAAEPTAARYDELQRAATDSYPFGPGDGCYAIAEAGYAGCAPGSGCRSGAGCLASTGLAEGQAMQVIAGALLPWLRGAPGARGVVYGGER